MAGLNLDPRFIAELDPQVIAEVVKSHEFKGEPAYALLVHVDDPHVNRGDTYNSHILVSGAGDVDYNKLIISLPSYFIDGNIVFTQWIDSRNPTTIDAPSPCCVELPIIFFTNALHTTNPVNQQESLCSVGERYNTEGSEPQPLLSFSFKIADDAPIGDHKYYLNLSYRSKNSQTWYTDRQELTIHINHWYEDEKVKYLIILPIIPILFAIIDHIELIAAIFSGANDPMLINFLKLLIPSSVIAIISKYVFDYLE